MADSLSFLSNEILKWFITAYSKNLLIQVVSLDF